MGALGLFFRPCGLGFPSAGFRILWWMPRVALTVALLAGTQFQLEMFAEGVTHRSGTV